jgi:hypothetical protein
MTGPGLRAAVLAALDRFPPAGPAFSAWWHDATESRRPYALTALHCDEKGHFFELGTLRDAAPSWCGELAMIPLVRIVSEALSQAGRLRVGQASFQVNGITEIGVVGDDDLWAGAPDRSSWGLELRSPTFLRAGRTNRPLPAPDDVFGSLLLRWSALLTTELADCCAGMAEVPEALAGLVTTLLSVNDFGGSPTPRLTRLAELSGRLAMVGRRVGMPERVRSLLGVQAGLSLVATSLENGLEIVDFDVHSALHVSKLGVKPLVGAVGTVWYQATGPLLSDRGLRRAVSALVGFAEFAGAGDMTTTGAGWVRELPAADFNPGQRHTRGSERR